MAKDSFRKTISTEDAVTTRMNATFEHSADITQARLRMIRNVARSVDRTRQIFPNHPRRSYRIFRRCQLSPVRFLNRMTIFCSTARLIMQFRPFNQSKDLNCDRDRPRVGRTSLRAC
ncbi:hypothetical protein [Bradyrhizobium sp. SRS-191]|uniref:hypothetical protein n=1 Tax=Bradyrhizobium sp. SRS-191 TaxID=2962606 RepID=UPI00211DF77D|nr:hypothetical protein [Bradyrhizobium sp. SRS-191]